MLCRGPRGAQHQGRTGWACNSPHAPHAVSDLGCGHMACVPWLGGQTLCSEKPSSLPRDPASGLGGVTGGWLPRKAGQVLPGKQGWLGASGPGGSTVTRVAVVPTH